MDKRCTKCSEVKSLESFGKNSRSKDGLMYMCKACNTAAAAAWQEANRVKANANNRAWVLANPEKASDTYKAWAEANPDRYAAIAGKGRVIRRGGSVSSIYNIEFCTPFYAESRRLTRETGIQHHVDHIVPLAKGGLHCQTNLQVLTASENIAKGDSHE